jgi:hypothetical protein
MATKIKTPIPRRMRVGKRMYSVEIVEALIEKSWKGAVNYDKRHIRIGRNSNLTGNPFTPAQVNETFWHEVTHAILYDMDSPLYKNESFVNAFASRLSKAIDSAKF